MMRARRSMRRRAAGRGAKRLVRADKIAALRTTWRFLAISFVVLWMLIAAAVTLMLILPSSPRPSYWSGLVIGIGIGLGIGLSVAMWREFLVGRGITPRELGVLAEQWTASELSRLDRQRWFVLHDLPSVTGNVDHVLVGPSRIHVIETKWSASANRPAFLSPAARQAEANARLVRTHLAAQGVVDREVVPMLVVWGPGTQGSDPEPSRDGETTVVLGAHASLWRARIEKADQGSNPDRVALEAIATPMAPRGGAPSNDVRRAGAAPRLPDDGDVAVTTREWRRHGRHRIYANVPGHDQSIGWIDVDTGHVHLEPDAPLHAARELTRARDRLHASEAEGGIDS